MKHGISISIFGQFWQILSNPWTFWYMNLVLDILDIVKGSTAINVKAFACRHTYPLSRLAARAKAEAARLKGEANFKLKLCIFDSFYSNIFQLPNSFVDKSLKTMHVFFKTLQALSKLRSQLACSQESLF